MFLFNSEIISDLFKPIYGLFEKRRNEIIFSFFILCSSDILHDTYHNRSESEVITAH